MAVVNQTLQDVVLRKIQEKSLRPTELIRELRKEAYPREIENALSELIENGTVEFGSDGLLRTSSVLAHAS